MKHIKSKKKIHCQGTKQSTKLDSYNSWDYQTKNLRFLNTREKNNFSFNSSGKGKKYA